jgi:hypothetical protein
MDPQSRDTIVALQQLIDWWCGQRRILPLVRLLPAYIAFDDLPAAWIGLCEALKDTQSLGPSSFNEAEWKKIKELILATQKLAGDRGSRPDQAMVQ